MIVASLVKTLSGRLVLCPYRENHPIITNPLAPQRKSETRRQAGLETLGQKSQNHPSILGRPGHPTSELARVVTAD